MTPTRFSTFMARSLIEFDGSRARYITRRTGQDREATSLLRRVLLNVGKQIAHDKLPFSQDQSLR
jgi:hypothetical protein